jgi:HEPN domain-containing protein
MDNDAMAIEWLKSAKANLYRGKDTSYLDREQIPYELLCFDLQQCVEKCLKAILIKNNINFRRTHDISKIIDLLVLNHIKIPEYIIENAITLTQYASETRYPGDWEPIIENEYKELVEITEKVYELIEGIIKSKA